MTGAPAGALDAGDDDLRELVSVWPDLSADTKASILAMVKAAGRG